MCFVTRPTKESIEAAAQATIDSGTLITSFNPNIQICHPTTTTGVYEDWFAQGHDKIVKEYADEHNLPFIDREMLEKAMFHSLVIEPAYPNIKSKPNDWSFDKFNKITYS